MRMHHTMKVWVGGEWKPISTLTVVIPLSFYYFNNYKGDRGGTVVKVLCYKSEGRWFDPRWCHWNFSLT